MATKIPDLSRPGPLDLVRGFSMPFRAIRMIFSTSRLALFTSLIAVVTFFALMGVLVVAWRSAPELATLIWAAPESWWGVALHSLLVALVFGLVFLVGANVVPPALVAPLMDPLSQQAERSLGIELADEGGLGRIFKEALRALANMLVRLAVLVAGYAVMLPLLIIPAIGGPLWTVLSWCWTACWVAISYLDVPMARHLYSFDHEVGLLKRRLPLCLGFGAAIALLLYVPILNLFFVPVAVVSGTVLFRALVAAGSLPPPRDEARAAAGKNPGQ